MNLELPHANLTSRPLSHAVFCCMYIKIWKRWFLRVNCRSWGKAINHQEHFQHCAIPSHLVHWFPLLFQKKHEGRTILTRQYIRIPVFGSVVFQKRSIGGKCLPWLNRLHQQKRKELFNQRWPFSTSQWKSCVHHYYKHICSSFD